jgi:hypothetical protein
MFSFAGVFLLLFCGVLGCEDEGLRSIFCAIIVFLVCKVRCNLHLHYEQHTAATMHHRCLHMTHAISLLILFICCVARAVFMIFCALPVPHTLQATPSATPVAWRCRHL